MTDLTNVKNFELKEAIGDGEGECTSTYPVAVVKSLPKVDKRILAYNFNGKVYGKVKSIRPDFEHDFVANKEFYRVYFLLDNNIEREIIVTL